MNVWASLEKEDDKYVLKIDEEHRMTNTRHWQINHEGELKDKKPNYNYSIFGIRSKTEP